MPDKGQITVQEAGRRGGQKTAKTHGREFYKGIGKKGGVTGGQTTLKRYGREFYQRIGRQGGAKVRELIEAGKKARGER